MNKWQVEDIRNWLDDDPKHMADANQVFDKKLMDVCENITISQDLLSGRIFDALIGGQMAKDRAWKLFELKAYNMHRWVPWGTLKNFYTDGDGWNKNLTDEEFWGAITDTTNHKKYFYSFMIKVLDGDKVLIKVTPRGGLKAKRKLSIDGKGDGNGKGEGKGQKAGPAGGKMEGKGQMGGWPAASSTGPTGGTSGGQTPGVMDPGPPPAQTATPFMGPPKNWVVGDYMPA
eukprot:7597444-Heterocapsa_arctica.AAC.1